MSTVDQMAHVTLLYCSHRMPITGCWRVCLSCLSMHLWALCMRTGLSRNRHWRAPQGNSCTAVVTGAAAALVMCLLSNSTCMCCMLAAPHMAHHRKNACGGLVAAYCCANMPVRCRLHAGPLHTCVGSECHASLHSVSMLASSPSVG